jgi:hypothetical protein
MENLFFTRYRDIIKASLGIDDDIVDKLAFETSRRKGYSYVLKHPYLMYGLLAIITNILYPLKRIKKYGLITDKEFVLVSCPDSVFRTKTIGCIAGSLSYSVIYLPNFHFFSALRYNKYFKKKRIEAFFPTIRLKEVVAAKRKMNQLKKCLNVSKFGKEELIALGVIANFLIYDYVTKNILKNTSDFKGKWILEHDKFYFTPMVVNLHQMGKTCTMLQHGCFMEIDSDFFPLFCDKVLCCSERERNAYIDCGVNPFNVIVFGAPLQTLKEDNKEFLPSRKNCYELLILLTAVNDESIQSVKSVLSFVKDNYDSVLVRFRPRSKKKDEKLLKTELEGMKVSDGKSTLSEDIASCNKVISFSEDANVAVIEHNKPFIYVHSWLGENRTLRRDLPYATIDNYKEEIMKLMGQDFYSTFSKEQYRDIVGETDVEVLKKRFEDYIRN